MARSAPLLVAMTMGLVGCVFDWGSLDPRAAAGTGGTAGDGGGVVDGGGGQGGDPTTSTGGTTSSGGASTSVGGAGGGQGGEAGMGGAGGSGGSPPPECDGVPVPLLANGQAITGSTLQAPTNFEASCAGTTGGEIVYAFELSAAADVLVDTTLAGTNYDTVLHVRADACEDAANEVGCLDRGVGDDLQLVALPAGLYFVIVDSHTVTNEGNFELMVSW